MASRRTCILLLLALAVVAHANTSATEEDSGYLYVSHEHAAWPSPEALVRDLHSKDEQVRLNALQLVGLTSDQAHVKTWSSTWPEAIGEEVLTPDQVELSYAALGGDSTQQAIVALEADRKQLTSVAVAVPKATGWERIATSDCWCKYEMYTRDALHEFVRLLPAPEPGPQSPEHFELVLRASGGGTGIYTQNEGHFRVVQGELRLVMTFVSRYRSCDPTGPARHCDLKRRWFYHAAVGNGLGGVLVESRGRFPAVNQSEALWRVRGLETRFLQPPTCVTYEWNAQTFQYEQVNQKDPCQPVKQ
jgi:hypothetical protein